MPSLASVMRLRAARTRLGVPEPRGPALVYTRLFLAVLADLEKQLLREIEDSPDVRRDALHSLTELIERMHFTWQEAFSRPRWIPNLAQVSRAIERFNWRELSSRLQVNPIARDAGLAASRDQFIEENIGLIQKMSDDQLRKIEAVIEDGTRRQLTVRELSEQIRKRFDVSRSRAMLIARDQTLKHNARLTRERHQALGINQYIWDTSQDERVRDAHEEVHGQTFSYDDPPVLSSGFQGHPGEDINCRCVAIPVIQ